MLQTHTHEQRKCETSNAIQQLNPNKTQRISSFTFKLDQLICLLLLTIFHTSEYLLHIFLNVQLLFIKLWNEMNKSLNDYTKPKKKMKWIESSLLWKRIGETDLFVFMQNYLHKFEPIARARSGYFHIFLFGIWFMVIAYGWTINVK